MGNRRELELAHAADDVTIGPVAATTVTHSAGNDGVHSLYTTATLNLTGGALSIASYGQLYGNFAQSDGTLTTGGAGVTSYGAFKQTAGGITINTGTLSLNGSVNSLAGSVGGGGWLQLGAGPRRWRQPTR